MSATAGSDQHAAAMPNTASSTRAATARHESPIPLMLHLCTDRMRKVLPRMLRQGSLPPGRNVDVRREAAKAKKAAPFGTAFPLSAGHGWEIRRAKSPCWRSCSHDLPWLACDNETSDHLLSVIEQGLGYGVCPPGIKAWNIGRRVATAVSCLNHPFSAREAGSSAESTYLYPCALRASECRATAHARA